MDVASRKSVRALPASSHRCPVSPLADGPGPGHSDGRRAARAGRLVSAEHRRSPAQCTAKARGPPREGRPGSAEAVGELYFLSLGSLTDGRLSAQVCPGTSGLSDAPRAAREASPIAVAQMASPNDKANSNMSWRRCQPTAYLSCHGSLLDQGHPLSWSCSLPWARIIYRKLLITGSGEGAETGFPEQAWVIFFRVWEVNNSDNN